MKSLTLLVFLLIALSCGTEVSRGPDIDMIRDRLDRNACKIVREDLVFQMGELEFVNDTTYADIPFELLADSLSVCPVTEDQLLMVRDGNHRKIVCPSGHGQTDF